MAQIKLIRNPLRPREIEHFESSASVIDWLQSFAPNGFGGLTRVHINGAEVEMDDWGKTLAPNDFVIVSVMPAGPVLTPAIINILVSLAVTYVVNYFFGPEVPTNPAFAERPEANTIYSLSSKQNAAKVGDVIPVIYGEVLTTPDYASQPYTEYTEISQSNVTTSDTVTVFDDAGSGANLVFTTEGELWELYRRSDGILDYRTLYPLPLGYSGVLPALSPDGIQFGFKKPGNTSYYNPIPLGTAGEFSPQNTWTIPASDRERGSGDQWLHYLLSIGLGNHTVTDILIGNISYNDLASEDVITLLQNARDHKNTYGNFASNFNSQNAIQDSFHENVITSLEVGTQELSSTEVTNWYPVTDVEINRIGIDIVFDRGFYSVFSGSGEFVKDSITFRIDYDGPYSGSQLIKWETDIADTSALRRSIVLDVPAGAGYRVRLQRGAFFGVGQISNSNSVFRWAGLRGYATPPADLNVYNGTALLGIRLKSGETVSTAAQNRIRVRAVRTLPPYASFSIFKANPAKVAVDVVANAEYGAAMPIESLDMPLLEQLYNYWGGQNSPYQFNGVFNGKTTVYEALKAIFAINAAEPLPVGGLLSVSYEGRRDFPLMMFSEANIVKDTFQISYQFDKVGDYDSIRVEYRDPETWQVAYAYWPPQTVGDRNLQVQLFGCTSPSHALEYAKFTFAKRQLLRRNIIFDTELEGLIPRAGDMIAVSHSLPSWSESGQVVEWNPSTLIITLDKDVKGYGFSMAEGQLILRATNGVDLDVLDGELISPREVLLSSPPLFNIYGAFTDTPTLYAWGEKNNVVRYFTVTNAEHSGGVVINISARDYNDNVFSDGMDFLENTLV